MIGVLREESAVDSVSALLKLKHYGREEPAAVQAFPGVLQQGVPLGPGPGEHIVVYGAS